jgi:hypothetical protein
MFELEPGGNMASTTKQESDIISLGVQVVPHLVSMIEKSPDSIAVAGSARCLEIMRSTSGAVVASNRLALYSRSWRNLTIEERFAQRRLEYYCGAVRELHGRLSEARVVDE